MVAKGLLLTYSFAIGLSYDQAVRETTIIESGTKTRFCLFGLSQKPFFRLSQRKKVFAAAEEAGNVEWNDGRSQARPSYSEDISSLPTGQHKNSFSSEVSVCINYSLIDLVDILWLTGTDIVAKCVRFIWTAFMNKEI